MKKLFIGCGVLVLIALGAVGYFAYQLYPQWAELQARWTEGFERLKDLEREHPFDPQAQAVAPLDAPRFAASLDLRAALTDDLDRIQDKLRNLGRKDAEGNEPGVIDSVRAMISTTTPLLGTFEARLREKQMSWPEFAFYTRLLWGCLKRVDAGVGLPELEPLHGAYDRFKQGYDNLLEHDAQNLPALQDLLGSFPAPLLNEASALLAQDVRRVHDSLRIVGTDHFYMQPITRIEDLPGLQAAQQDFARTSAENAAANDAEPAVAAPAGKPEPLGKVPDSELAPPAEPAKPGDK